MLRHEVPAVYEIIMKMTPGGLFPEPRIQTIEIVCRASKDPSLRKPKFFRYLELYRKDGIYCRRPRVLTPARARFYESMRRRKLAGYIQCNRAEVEKECRTLRHPSPKDVNCCIKKHL